MWGVNLERVNPEGLRFSLLSLFGETRFRNRLFLNIAPRERSPQYGGSFREGLREVPAGREPPDEATSLVRAFPRRRPTGASRSLASGGPPLGPPRRPCAPEGSVPRGCVRPSTVPKPSCSALENHRDWGRRLTKSPIRPSTVTYDEVELVLAQGAKLLGGDVQVAGYTISRNASREDLARGVS